MSPSATPPSPDRWPVDNQDLQRDLEKAAEGMGITHADIIDRAIKKLDAQIARAKIEAKLHPSSRPPTCLVQGFSKSYLKRTLMSCATDKQRSKHKQLTISSDGMAIDGNGQAIPLQTLVADDFSEECAMIKRQLIAFADMLATTFPAVIEHYQATALEPDIIELARLLLAGVLTQSAKAANEKPPKYDNHAVTVNQFESGALAKLTRTEAKNLFDFAAQFYAPLIMKVREMNA